MACSKVLKPAAVLAAEMLGIISPIDLPMEIQSIQSSKEFL